MPDAKRIISNIIFGLLHSWSRYFLKTSYRTNHSRSQFQITTVEIVAYGDFKSLQQSIQQRLTLSIDSIPKTFVPQGFYAFRLPTRCYPVHELRRLKDDQILVSQRLSSRKLSYLYLCCVTSPVWVEK